MATNPNSAPAPKTHECLSHFLDLEPSILAVGSLQRVAEIVLDMVFDCKRPGPPEEEDRMTLVVSNEDVSALQHALMAATDATARLRAAYYAAWKNQNTDSGGADLARPISGGHSIIRIDND